MTFGNPPAPGPVVPSGGDARMTLHPVKELPCTVCGTRFSMVHGAMVNPADTLCNGCILTLWDGPVDTADLARRLQPRMGMAPEALASAIAGRVERLRDVVASREELVQLLAQRADTRG